MYIYIYIYICTSKKLLLIIKSYRSHLRIFRSHLSTTEEVYQDVNESFLY